MNLFTWIHSAGALKSFMCGSSAGIAYWVSIYPLDSVKSRVQVLSAEGQVQGLAKTFVNILRTEGEFESVYVYTINVEISTG